MTAEEAILTSIVDKLPYLEIDVHLGSSINDEWFSLCTSQTLRQSDYYFPCRIHIKESNLIINLDKTWKSIDLFTCEDVIKEVANFIKEHVGIYV